MSTKNKRPRHARTKTDRSQTERIRAALEQARSVARLVKRGDEDMLARATILQGVVSGDVVAASIHARQRMQREILRLKTRLAHAHLKTEAVKQRLLEAEATTIEHAELPAQMMMRIREIYGLPQREIHQLAAADLTAEAIPPSQASQKSQIAPVEAPDASPNS